MGSVKFLPVCSDIPRPLWQANVSIGLFPVVSQNIFVCGCIVLTLHHILCFAGFQREDAAPQDLPPHRRQEPQAVCGAFTVRTVKASRRPPPVPFWQCSPHVLCSPDWSIDQVEALSERGHFPESELLSVAFMMQMEELGSLPASRCAAKHKSQRYRSSSNFSIKGSKHFYCQY